MKVLSLVGARPQFIKEAVLSDAVREQNAWEHIVVHSGQHYDADMSDVFFRELNISAPKYQLNIGSGSHGAMTAAALTAVEEVILKEKPDIVLVYGDTNTTLAGALAAAKLKIPVAHVEAGLRQEPKDMPEEINRVLTDRISHWLFCCSQTGTDNLKQEGIVSGVAMAGDIMYDLFLKMKPSFSHAIEKALHLAEQKYVVVTLHRDFNVDSPELLSNILRGINEACRELELKPVFPLHPRTKKRIGEFCLSPLLESWHILAPIGYMELMGLVENSAFVISDSGGLQKEAYYAGKRCAVVMPDTGWRELTDCGWNCLAKAHFPLIKNSIMSLKNPVKYPRNIYGDGTASLTILSTLKSKVQ